MKPKDLTELSDQELLQEAKKKKAAAITNAILIGFLIGVVCFSIIKSTLGLFTLIPLFFAYKLINNSKYDNKELEELLKQRGLK
ncbi:hypothetical protein [Mucilaginibacter phyllosphaerae]